MLTSVIEPRKAPWIGVLLTSLAIGLLSATPALAAQIFVQNFGAGGAPGDHDDGTANEFNSIAASGGTSITGNALRLIRDGGEASFSRTTDFSPTPTALMFKFSVNLFAQNSDGGSQSSRFRIGRGFSTSTTSDANSDSTYAQFGLDIVNTDGSQSTEEIRFRNIATGTQYPASPGFLTGTQNVVWVLNNSGATLRYIAPSGALETIANDTWDLWVGTTRAFNDAAVLNATRNMNDFKFYWDSNSGTMDFDNFDIRSLTAVTASETHANVSCFGGSNGSITATFTGGTTPYQAKIDAGSFAAETSPKLYSGLTAGSHLVTVQDSDGSADTASAFLTQPATAVSVVLNSQTNVTCFGASTGAINVTASGGTAPRTFSWNGGAYTTEDLSGIPAGAYNLTVTDANGCTAVLPTVTITQPAELVATLDGVTDVSCFGGTNGAINVSVTGGTGSPTYLWSNGSTNQDQSGLAAGSYSLTVTDANGCTATFGPQAVGEPAELVVTLDGSTDVSCFDGSDGAINVTVTGGTGAYTYSWNSGAYTTENLIGIPAGSYTLTVTDENGCEETLGPVAVGEPAELVVTLDG